MTSPKSKQTPPYESLPPRSPSPNPSAKHHHKTNLYIGNIPYTFSEKDLEMLCEKFGVLKNLNLPIDKYTHRNKGFCFVEFEDSRDALEFFDIMSKETLDGRMLKLDFDAGLEKKQKRPYINWRNIGFSQNRGPPSHARDDYEYRRDQDDDRRHENHHIRPSYDHHSARRGYNDYRSYDDRRDDSGPSRKFDDRRLDDRRIDERRIDDDGWYADRRSGYGDRTFDGRRNYNDDMRRGGDEIRRSDDFRRRSGREEKRYDDRRADSRDIRRDGYPNDRYDNRRY